MKSVLSQVDDLKAKLAIQEVELKEKNEAADALIEIVRVETEKVSTEKAVGKAHSAYASDISFICQIVLSL
jgi:dynein heavy chain